MVRRTDPRFSPATTGTIVLAYASFAALWIFLSDKAVVVLSRGPATIVRVGTAKGWLFVVVTSLLLLALLRRFSGTADPQAAPVAARRRLFIPIAILALGAAVLTGGAIAERFRQQDKLEAMKLGIIADHKSRQIARWLEEREKDAHYLATSRFYADSYLRWQKTGDAAVGDSLRKRLDEYRRANGFEFAALFDGRGEMLLHTSGSVTEDAIVRVAARAASAEGRVRRVGPYRDAAGVPHLDFVAPLEYAGAAPPVVFLHTDAAAELQQMTEEWLERTSSAEGMLYRLEGGRFTVINRLRHLPDSALRLRLPASGGGFPALPWSGQPVAADHAFEGVDYRGVKTLGVARAVPGTDWFLAVKMDKAELRAEAVAEAAWIGLAGLLSFLAVSAGIVVFDQRRQLADSQRERQAQSERLQTLQLLEAVSESSGDAIFVKDLEGRYLVFNGEAARSTGKRREEVLGRDDRVIFPPPEADMLMEIGRRVAAEDRTVTNEEVLSTVEGTRTFLATKGPLHDEAGRVIAIFGISRDITARKTAEQALRDNEAFVRAVLDNLPVGIAVNSVDPAMAFEYMNDNFPRFYRTTREKLVGPDAFWAAVYEDPAFREWIRAQVLKDCASGDAQRMDWIDVPIVRGDKTYYVSARSTPVPGKPLVISVVWDVTERKQAEEERAALEAQLHQAQKMESVGRLAGGIAHDFNNLLFVIMGYVALALERVAPSHPAYGDLQEIRGAAQRSANLTRQLLAFARRQTAAPQLLDPNRAVAGMLSILRRLIGEDIELAWRPGEAVWPVKIDPAQLDQIMVNLCVNARDAIASVGRVAIETRNVEGDEPSLAGRKGWVPGDYVVLSVSDDGSGMTPEVLSHVFEPFFTTKEAGRGTGLGLSTVYGIVKQNNGFIAVDSVPGAGTTVSIYLRRGAGTPAEASAEPIEDMPVGHGETVLLVEDEPAILNLCATMLERLGYSVLTAGTATEAIRLAVTYAGAIRLMVTDVVMPGMNGKELAARIGDTNPAMKLLFMSGYTAGTIAERGVLDDHVRFIKKPFSIRELAHKVREALAGAEVGAAGVGASSGVGGVPGRRVLYVDDEDALLELARRMLERRGHHVAAFTDPVAALAEFQRRPAEFDFVVTDVSMQGMSGFDFARSLLAVKADVPIVVASGFVRPEDTEGARALGLYAVIEKPGTVDQLGVVLDRLFQSLPAQAGPVQPGVADSAATGT